MKTFKITGKDGSKIDVVVKVTTSEIKEIWQKMKDAAKAADDNNFDVALGFIDFIDSLVFKATGLSQEEFNCLDSEEIQEINNYVTSLAENRLGFMRR